MASAGPRNNSEPCVPAEYLLIIDLGTQSMRANVFDRSGRVHWHHAQPLSIDRAGERCEQDPADWERVLRHILLTVGSQPGLADGLKGIAATGTLAGLVCLDAAGVPLRKAILYADGRPAVQVAEIEAHPEFAPIREQTGWRATVGDFLPQVAYLRQCEPDHYTRSRWLLDSTGYLNHLLTGRAAVDAFTLFSCYSLTGAFPHRLLAALGIDESKLGTPMRIGQSIGLLRPEWCREYGLPPCPVFSIPYDSASAYLGADLRRPGEALDISGTVTSFGVLHRRQVQDRERRIYSLPYEHLWLVRGSTAAAGAALEWARTIVLRGSHAEFDALVAAAPAGANGVLFLPYLSGERAPLWNPEATGAFAGLRASSTLADMMRAVAEGICFSLLHIQTVIEENGVQIGDVLLAGGLARNQQFNRIKADITGRRLIPLEDFELTMLGAATIAGGALGWWTRQDAAALLLRRQTPIDPDPGQHARYRHDFARYLTASELSWPTTY
jgi:xylulokinase